MSKLTDTEVKDLFAEIDTDGDGEIRLRELRDYGQTHEGTLQGTKLADFVRSADNDGNRRISLTEFTAFFA
ncbi:EF-hand domain-containing protein [Streptomyces sp. NPDC094049]|uniref:EF-hand domain-containing protein n=1 Tax=Streptomyces sp. NPDC094049 TaxID=3154987 RepID=UPI00332CB5F9